MLTTDRRVRCRTTCTLESTCALGFSPQLLKLDLEDAGLASTLSYGPVGFGCGLRTGGGAMPITMAQLASGERVTRGRPQELLLRLPQEGLVFGGCMHALLQGELLSSSP